MIAAFSCPELQSLSDYLHGDLPDPDSAELERHIVSCDRGWPRQPQVVCVA